MLGSGSGSGSGGSSVWEALFQANAIVSVIGE